MAKPGGTVSYSSLSNVEKNNKVHCVDDLSDSAWAKQEGGSTLPSGSKSLRQEYLFQYPLESEEFFEGGYDSGEDNCSSVQHSTPPEVNLKNVLSGICAIVTGRNKGSGAIEGQKFSTSNVSFLGSAKSGETFLHSSVYIPSAPPLIQPNAMNYSAQKDMLEAEPPEWLPDSSTTACMQCTASFTALTRGRHHCRFCGGIFCRECSKGRCLLPVKFRERNPQRVCDTCYDRLDPLQDVLINTISNAVQVAVIITFIKEIMKQHLIFLVALLTTLSMVNAIPYFQLDKRATTFGPCLTGSPFPITVSLQPDPPVPGQDCIFTVTGTIDSGINPGAKMVVQGFDAAGNQINDPIATDICSITGMTCPVTSFSIIRTIPISANLSGMTYSIAISILSETGAVLGCSMGTITG